MVSKLSSYLARVSGPKSGRPSLFAITLLTTAGLVMGLPRAALAQDGDGDEAGDEATYSVQVENDLFASGNDRHYTNGIRLSYLTKARSCDTDEPCLSNTLRAIASFIPGYKDGEDHRISYSLGQNMYTPSDITDPNPRPGDRPYAGWLYAGMGFVSRDTYQDKPHKTYNRIDNVEVNLGIVGPWSLGSTIHKGWHDLFNFTPPRGWENPLKNEPGIVLMYERIWQFKRRPSLVPGLELELSPTLGAALGNVYTHAAAGARVRIGKNIADDYGPPRIRPSLPGSDYFTPRSNLGFYAFAGVEGRAVARNIFLDGNTFRKSLSVDKRHFVGDVQLGAALTAPRYGFLPPFRLSYTYIFRSKEYKGQEHPDKFGSINLSFNL